MSNNNLFNEFAAISTTQWIEKIKKDLKGKPFEKLIRKTAEGFDLLPFYREEDLSQTIALKNLPGDFPFLRGNRTQKNHWLVRQDIVVNDIAQANAKALDIRSRGVDSLGFVFPDTFSFDLLQLEDLLHYLRADMLELNFSGGEALDIIKSFDHFAKKYNRDLEKIKGSVNYDPLGYFATHGKFKESETDDLEYLLHLFEAGIHLPHFHLLTVNAHIFHNAGGGVVSELVYALSMGADYLTYLTDKGMAVDEAAPKIRFHFAVGSEYFMEIAKFRAFRFLWAKIVNAYGLQDAQNAVPFIHCSSSYWNKTVYDPYVNMLRTTTETMSALIGGVDSMSVMPFDAVYTRSDDFSNRIARNQQLILREESYFDKVIDPAAGSYYIENLTSRLIEKSWERFLTVDKHGGFLAALRKGEVQSVIRNESESKDREIALRKRSVLGVNQYPNTTEKIEGLEDESILFPIKADKTGRKIEPLTLYRGAMVFERLRYQTDRYAQKNRRPKVWMFTFGNLAIRRARSQFAGNFFGVAGYEIIDNAGFDTVEEGVEAAKQARPDIVVLCASDEDYETIATAAFNALKEDFIVVIAGYPASLIEPLKKAGMNRFIHVKSNVLEELKKYQKLLGIEKV